MIHRPLLILAPLTRVERGVSNTSLPLVRCHPKETVASLTDDPKAVPMVNPDNISIVMCTSQITDRFDLSGSK